MKTIVLGYDDTEPSKRALERAGAIAKAFGSQVIVTSVAGLMHPAPRGGGLDPIETPDAHREEIAHAVEALTAQGLSVTTQLAVGDAAKAIVEVAEETGADLIVIGAREHGFFSRMFGESVSEGVSHHATCDVLIVH